MTGGGEMKKPKEKKTHRLVNTQRNNRKAGTRRTQCAGVS